MSVPEPGATDPREAILAQLPARLRQRREELAAALSARLHHDGQEEHVEAGLPRRAEETDDDAAAETQRERDLTDLARMTSELAQIDAVLARAASGDLGECAECSEPIDAARLNVNPAALRCAECQQLIERRQARSRLLGA